MKGVRMRRGTDSRFECSVDGEHPSHPSVLYTLRRLIDFVLVGHLGPLFSENGSNMEVVGFVHADRRYVEWDLRWDGG